MYNISISVTNETECFRLLHNNTCHRYLQYGVLHNLMGKEYGRDEHLTWIKHFSFLNPFRYILDCYQHLHEFLCYVFVPKFDPVSKQVIHPCREMCQDVKNACDLFRLFVYLKCSYLPSLRGDVPCFYDPVFCGFPPLVKNATVKTNSSRPSGHFLNDTAEYSCDESFEMVGNRNITCT